MDESSEYPRVLGRSASTSTHLLSGDAVAFRATLRPEFAPLAVALSILTLESPADARTLHLAGAGATRSDLQAALLRRRDFDRAAVAAAVDAAAVAPGEGVVLFAIE